MTIPSRVATLETGNAADAGTASRGWFVGDLAAWAAPGACVSLGLLVDGDMRIDFRARDGAERTCLTVRWPTDPDHDADPARRGHHG